LIEFPEGLGDHGRLHPLAELLGGQPACRVVLAQQRRDLVAIRVRGADTRVTWHQAPSYELAESLSLVSPRGCPVCAGAGSSPFGMCPVVLSSAVSTQGPSAVMATVCSKCAAQLPSAVMTVQSSSSSTVSGSPSMIIGSMASAMPARSRGPR